MESRSEILARGLDWGGGRNETLLLLLCIREEDLDEGGVLDRERVPSRKRLS